MGDILEEAKQRQNRDINNGRLKTDDMLWYLISRVDSIHDSLDSKVDKKMFRWAMGLLVTGILGLVGFLTLWR